MTFVLIMVALFGSSTIVCAQGSSLAADSAALSSYWARLESGEIEAARDYLLGLGEDGSQLEQMANFVLAAQSFGDADYEQVLVYLDSGVPEALGDHAAWMRAWSLNEAGFPENAAPYWQTLASDRISVYADEASLALAGYLTETGSHQRALDLLESCAESGLPQVDRLRAGLLKSQTLTKLDRHGAAIDGLWGLISDHPRSPESREAREILKLYPTAHAVTPRQQAVGEYLRELGALENEGQHEPGLRRIEQARQQFSGRETEETNLYYTGRFQAGLKRYSDAIHTLDAYLRVREHDTYRTLALYHLGRAAYLIDQDSTAIAAFQQLEKRSDDVETVRNGLELFGLLLQDRGRSNEAIAPFQQWLRLAPTESERSDATWRLAWAHWDAGQWQDAQDHWSRLAGSSGGSDYGPAAIYWSARAAEKSGGDSEASQLRGQLIRLFPYSYYATLLSHVEWTGEIADQPLRPQSLDDIYTNGGVHSRKFALLAAMRLADAALDELPAAKNELADPDSWGWWQVQLELWRGNRLEAWRTLRNQLGKFIRAAGDRPRPFFDLVYPLDYEPMVIDQAARYRVGPYFIFALICQESHYEEAIVSSAGAIGLMQLMPATARLEAAKVGVPYAYERLSESDYNLQLGISHVASLMAEFSGDSVLVLAAYNAGKEAVHKWLDKYGYLPRDEFIEKIPYRETRLFVKRILEHQAAYKRLYPDVVQVNAVIEGLPGRRP